MIIVIDALNKSGLSNILTEVHKLRKRVFKDRLDWDVEITNGCEVDEFDRLDPAHVVCLDDEGHVVGSMRLLQTTGPHMLSDIFSCLLDGEAPLRSAQIWEATRFCVDTDRLTTGRGRNSISQVTSEVMIGAFEFAMEAGVLDAVAVIDPVMDRVLKRSNNAPYDYLGSPKPMGKVTALAALMDCSDERIAGIREFSGIEGDVFVRDEETQRKLDAQLAPAQPEINLDLPELDLPSFGSTEELMRYCEEQLRAAQTQKDTDAALALVQAISGMLAR